jgi:maleylacetoacetate isomerase/maleylpyruvate isomerase
MNEFVLYNYFRSSTSYRARIALNLKNAVYIYRSVHLINQGGEQFTEDYKRLNPLSEVPTLVHNGKSIAQSMAIIEYLEDLIPTPALFPKDIFLKAQVRQFCENINSFMHPLSNLKVLQYLEQKFQITTVAKEAWVHEWFHRGFTATENLLQKTSGLYCFADTVTAADVFLIPQVFSAQRYNFDFKKYPLVEKINQAAIKLPEFMAAHPYKQPDTPAEFI